MTPLAAMLNLATLLFSITWGIPLLPPKQESVKHPENDLPTPSPISDLIRIQEEIRMSLTPLIASLTTRRNEISTDNRRLILQLASALNLALVSARSYLISRNPLIPLDFQEKKTKKIFYFVSLSFPTDKLTFHR